MKSIPIGKDNFKKLIEENCYYIDKTMVIEELLNKNNEVVLYSRPRRFGKSLFISMLENFFDIDKREKNKNLFDGLKIKESEYFSHFGKYPVIALDFKDLKKENYELTYREFQNIISNLYEEKKYLLEMLDESQAKIFNGIKDKIADRADYERSLKYLSDWLEKYYHQKVIILIDEYDVPIQQGYIEGFYNNIVNLIKSVLSSALKGNDSLKMGVMTGVLRVSKESIFSDLNNLAIYDMMSRNYNEAFGFTEKETKELLEYYGLELTGEIKKYYDGYNFNGVSIYNPWSLLNYIDQMKLQSYWVNSSGNDLIIKLLSETEEENKIKLEELIMGKSKILQYNDKLTYLDFEKKQSWDNILNLLYASGYLTLDKIVETELGEEIYVKVPNLEVKEILIKIISYGFADESSELGMNIKEFNKAILKNNKEDMEKYLNRFLESMSYMDIHENFYHGYMLGLFSGFLTNNYIVKSNRESGLGRFDVLIEKEDRSFGCIMEFKVTNKEEEMEKISQEGKNQMRKKAYYKELEIDKVKNIKEYVVVFNGKKCIVR